MTRSGLISWLASKAVVGIYTLGLKLELQLRGLVLWVGFHPDRPSSSG